MKGYVLIKAKPGKKEAVAKSIAKLKLDGVTTEAVSGDRDYDFIVTITDESSAQSYLWKVTAVAFLETIENTTRLRVL